MSFSQYNFNRLGLPYHGLHKGRDFDRPNDDIGPLGLELPDGFYKYNPAIRGCRSRLMRNTARAQTWTPTAAETAAGRSWKDYLLVCGYNNCVGDAVLNDGAWLYVDVNANVWVMRLNPVPDPVVNNRIKLQFIVESLFGVLCSSEPFPQVNRVIYEHEINIQTGSALNATGAFNSDVDNTIMFADGVNRYLEYNKTGSDCILAAINPQQTNGSGQEMYLFTDTSYGCVQISDWPTFGTLTNIVRWTVSGNGKVAADATLGTGIQIAITRDDQYSYENVSTGNYEGPPGYNAGGKTFWFNTPPGESDEEWNVIGHYFFDSSDVLHEVRLKIDVDKESYTGTGSEWVYTAAIIDDDGTTETTVGTYSLTAFDYIFPYDDVFIYRPQIQFDRCGDTAVHGLSITDPWHPALPPGYTTSENGAMGVYYIATPDTPTDVNGVPSTTRWHKISDDTYYAGNAYAWPSYFNHAAWEPVDKKLYWVPPKTTEFPNYYPEWPIYI